MANKTDIAKFLNSSVAASSIDIFESPVIPAGKSVILRKFGGSIPVVGVGSFVALQWGSASSWETIRVVLHEIEYDINRQFVGDGSKKFRIVRQNQSATPQNLCAWIEGYY